jgi:hypothetical protein
LPGGIEKFHGDRRGRGGTRHEGLEQLHLDQVVLGVVMHLSHENDVDCFKLINEIGKVNDLPRFEINNPPLGKVSLQPFHGGQWRHGVSLGCASLKSHQKNQNNKE